MGEGMAMRWNSWDMGSKAPAGGKAMDMVDSYEKPRGGVDRPDRAMVLKNMSKEDKKKLLKKLEKMEKKKKDKKKKRRNDSSDDSSSDDERKVKVKRSSERSSSRRRTGEVSEIGVATGVVTDL